MALGDGLHSAEALLGYVSFPLDRSQRPLSFDESLVIADAGMYYAKRHGRSSAVRIEQLPTDLLADLGGLPAAVERESLTNQHRQLALQARCKAGCCSAGGSR